MSAALDRLRAELAAGLAERERAGLRRRLEVPAGIDLTTNDYLGYARDPDLAAEVGRLVAARGIGGRASRLLGGHDPHVAGLEAALAAWCGREAALLFPSGFQANVGLLPALVGPGDTVVSDALNHASLIDGMRLSGARRAIVPHGDPSAVEAALRDAGPGRRLVVTESVFSMDGDLAPLEALCDVADRHGAAVLVDEAHATGLWGARGSGRVEALGLADRVLATVHTGGKALGVGGAWVAGDRVLVDHLVNHARSFVYSTAPVPALVAGLGAALARRAADRPRVEALHARAARLRARLAAGGLDTGRSASPIVPVLLGAADRALDVAAALRADGFEVRAVRPPTVPEGTARLRLALHADLDDATLARLADRLLALAAPP